MNYIDYANPKEITLYNGNDLKKYLSGEDFVFLGIKQFPREILFSVKTGMLWTTTNYPAGGLKEWKDPTDKQIIDFVNLPNNPYCNQVFPFLTGVNLFVPNKSHLGWYSKYEYSDWCKTLGLWNSEVLKNKTWQEGFDFLKEQSWQISTLRNEIFLLHDSSLIPTEECGESDPTTLQDAIKNEKFIWIGDNQKPRIALWDLKTNFLYSSKQDEILLIYDLYQCKSLFIKNWKIVQLQPLLDNNLELFHSLKRNFLYINPLICYNKKDGCLNLIDPYNSDPRIERYSGEFGNLIFYNEFLKDKTWKQRAYFIEKYWQLSKLDGTKIDAFPKEEPKLETIGGND